MGESKSQRERYEEELQDFSVETTDGEDSESSKSPAEKWARLEKQLRKLEEEGAEYREMLQRKQAEFENFRKRTARERDDFRKSIQSEMVAELLPILDASEKGLEALRREDEGDPSTRSYLEGYELMVKQLQNFLERFGVEEVPGPGEKFDPNFHEAMLREVSEAHREEEIIEEYRKGYRIGDKLIRPSQVKVAVTPEEG